MTTYSNLKKDLEQNQHTWLITGVAGFIGSNLLEALLKLGQKVIGLDNFSTGNKLNLDQVLKDANYIESSSLFEFIEGDVSNYELCLELCSKADYVLHQAALGSVPRSIKNPIASNNSNVTGFLNILNASKESDIRRLVFASSSSVYGSDLTLPKVESKIGEPLSPYALTKVINEKYSKVFSDTYEFHAIGLRYFNVFGKRQNIKGPYAAVIPKWITAMIRGEQVEIYGDGHTGRDFCYVENAIQANLLSALSENKEAQGQIFNVALNDITSLNDLFDMIKSILSEQTNTEVNVSPKYLDFRPGDIKSSQADINKLINLLGYKPSHKIKDGLIETVSWFLKNQN